MRGLRWTSRLWSRAQASGLLALAHGRGKPPMLPGVSTGRLHAPPLLSWSRLWTPLALLSATSMERYVTIGKYFSPHVLRTLLVCLPACWQCWHTTRPQHWREGICSSILHAKWSPSRGVEYFSLREEMCFDYVRELQVHNAPPTRTQSFREASVFVYGVLEVDVSSVRCDSKHP